MSCVMVSKLIFLNKSFLNLYNQIVETKDFEKSNFCIGERIMGMILVRFSTSYRIYIIFLIMTIIVGIKDLTSV